jgi:S-adenosylmethionine:tRNA ribosyltransferase-isomerase
MLKRDLDYELPVELIAQDPPLERGSSRLLRLGPEQQVEHLQFEDFQSFLSENDVLVLNDTRVIPARLFGTKATGGKVEILIERLVSHECALAHIRASKAPKKDGLIHVDGGGTFQVDGRSEDLFHLRLISDHTLETLLDSIGHVPLPPYIERHDHAADRERYQTVFSRHKGAVAAPTAGLHFTDAFLDGLKKKGVKIAYVTLHVGSGTFQPLRVENLNDHKMHFEFCNVPTESVDIIQDAKLKGGRVVAVGTTVVRSLETASRGGGLKPYQGETNLFIQPGFKFNCVDGLLTNFHLPQSTLLALVCAFGGYKPVMAAYQTAIQNRYRFFSYGDAMFLFRNKEEASISV